MPLDTLTLRAPTTETLHTRPLAAALFGAPRREPERREKATPGTCATTRVETKRLILRPFVPQDLPHYASLVAEPGTFRYSERGAMSEEEAWSRLLRHAGHWSMLGYGLFAVEHKASGRLIGEVGFAHFRRRLGEPFDCVPEASWTIAGAQQGQGYATEAATAALRWLEANYRSAPTVCLIHAENAASLNVARKLGFEPYRECDYRGYRAILHMRPSSARTVAALMTARSFPAGGTQR